MTLRRFLKVIVAACFLLTFAGKALPQANQTVSNGATVPAVNFAGGECVYNWVNNNPSIGLAGGGTGNIPLFTAINNGTAPITATINAIPVNKGFAYILHPANNSLSAVNTLTNTVSATISVGQTPWFIAISPDQSRVYVQNLGDSSISVINTLTNKVINTIHVFKPPVNTTYTSLNVTKDGTKLLLSEGTNVYVVDAVTGKFLASGDAKVSGPASLGPDDFLYIAGGNSIGIFNTQSLYYSPPVSPQSLGYIFAGPNLLASRDSNRLYIMNDRINTVYAVWVISTHGFSTMKIIEPSIPMASLIITESPDAKLIYIHTQNQTSSYITVINTLTYQEVANIPISFVPGGMSLSPDGSLLYLETQKSNLLTIIDTKLNVIKATIQLSAPSGSNGNFVTGDCEAYSYTITVNPNPVITATGNLPALSTVYGTPSIAASFTISGTYTTGNILVTPPPGFEVSNDNINFSKSVKVTSSTTATTATSTVYIRLAKSTPAGNYSGNILLNSGNTTTLMPQPNSRVAPAALTITADNKTQFYGLDVPVLTATYKGFVNNDTIAQLTVPPTLTTTATSSSPAGKYAISVYGAISPNYTFTYFPGVLSIVPISDIFIPNTFTPNADGINDTWNIKLLSNFPDCTVQIVNRYGERVYYSHNYPIPWDGTYKNAPLPFGTYYYIINFGYGRGTISGHVTIVR
jgi:gliding motility-associated-like protein